MGKGKLAAQCCHGAVGVYKTVKEKQGEKGELWRAILDKWEWLGEKKIVTKIQNEGKMY